MKPMVDFLQGNAYAVIIISILGVGSAIIGIVTGWQAFYNRLSKEIKLPVWAFSLIALLLSVSGYYMSIDKTHDLKESELKHIKGAYYGVEPVLLDGKRFERCKFQGSQLVFRGSSGVELLSCELQNITILFDGPPARAFTFLSNLHKEPGGKVLVENYFSRILEGKGETKEVSTQVDDL